MVEFDAAFIWLLALLPVAVFLAVIEFKLGPVRRALRKLLDERAIRGFRREMDKYWSDV